LEQNPIDAAFVRKVDAWLCGQQGFGVRVAWRFVHALDRADFDDAPQDTSSADTGSSRTRSR